MGSPRELPSKLRQPKQYASPPSTHKRAPSDVPKDRSVSDMSDDASDSDSCIFPLQLNSPKMTRRRMFRSISPKAKERMDLETKVQALTMSLSEAEQREMVYTARIHELEECVAAATEQNATLREEINELHAQRLATSGRMEQLEQMRKQAEEKQALAEEKQALAEEKQAQAEEQRLMQENEWRSMWVVQQERIASLYEVMQDLEAQLDDCHAAMHAWQEQAKQAEQRSRSLWQERMMLESDLVRSSAQDAPTTDERQQRMNELKALQGLRSVTLSVFKDEDEQVDATSTHHPSQLQTRSSRNSSSSSSSSSSSAKPTWIDTWIERQVKSHEDVLAWLETLEHHIDEDAKDFSDTLATHDWSSSIGMAQSEAILREIEDLLKTCSVSIADTEKPAFPSLHQACVVAS